jgi:hypothetical protein
MQTFAQYALPGTILASAVGAVVLCVVLFFYGFRSEPDDEGPAPGRRLLVIRLGHALAAACFAAAVMLSTVALIDQRRIAAPAPSVTALPTDDVPRLEAQMKALEQRLAATELRLGDVVQQRAALESRPPGLAPLSRPRKPASAPARRPAPSPPAIGGSEVAAAPAPVREEPKPATGDAGATVANREATARPAMSEPPASSVSPSPAPAEDLRTKVREDWKTVKRGFRQAGESLRSGFADLGRRLKDTFARDAD